MEETQDIEDEEGDLEPEESGKGDPRDRKSELAKHLVQVDEQTAFLTTLPPAERKSVLREVIAGTRKMFAEVLVRLSIAAHRAGDRPDLSLTFEALIKTATPLLASQAWDLDGDDIKDQVQEILLELFEDIRRGRADMAGRVFAAWAKRRSISLYRKRAARFEGSYDRVELTAESDPVDKIAGSIPSHEARVLLDQAIGKLPPKHAAAFIRVHIFGMTQKEVAEQMDVNVRTLGEWLKKSAEALGYDGDDDERKA